MERFLFLRLTKQGATLRGPFHFEEVKNEFMIGRIGLQDLVYSPHTDAKWLRFYEVKCLQEFLFPLPNAEKLATFAAEAKKKSSPPPTCTTWLLKFEGSEFGPFSPPEIEKILDSKKLKGALFARPLHSKQWLPFSQIDQLQEALPLHFEDTSFIDNENDEIERADSRTSLIATVSRTLSGVSKMIGVCADISEGGMQVINTSKIELKTGELMDLVVSPVAQVGVEPFRVQAKVGWVTLNPHKAGFQFLDFESNLSLKKYISKNLR